MRIPDPTATNVAICNALGIDATKVPRGGVTIILDGRRGPIVEVTYQGVIEPEGELVQWLKRYKLIPIEET